MNYRSVKSMDDKFSTLGLGCWAFSGEVVWDGYDEKQSIATIHEAQDMGINVFDVAPVYGFGLAEEIVGKSLRNRPRDKAFIASKCGLVWDNEFRIANNLSAQSIRSEVEDSLRRLQTDYIDLYQMHWPDPSTPVEASMEVLLELTEQGKIRHIGVSNFSVALSEEAMKYGPIAAQQSLYNMVERNASTYHETPLSYRTEAEILPLCARSGQAFLPYSPLFQGLLSGVFSPKGNFSENDIRNHNKKLAGDTFEQLYALVEQLKQYCKEGINRPLNEVAINWLLYRQEVTSVICGAQNAAQLRSNAKAMEWTLSKEHYEALNKIVEQHKVDSEQPN
ncbi:aldo/keto reductase [Paenibacillaceae bacterium]|nr:aldo/keto reductase [Paenibacillaceae bacterium]